MSEYTELLERLDYDANCGPGDGLPSMLDIVAMDCKKAAEAIRLLLAERSADAVVRDAIFALMPESLYWAEVPDDIKALRERAAKAEAERDRVASTHKALMLEQERKTDEAESRLAAVLEELRTILPMAKGYAVAHPVGNNVAMIESAERALQLVCAHGKAADEGCAFGDRTEEESLGD